jgi:hypothetical protein
LAFAAGAALSVIAIGAGVAFQDNISRFLINPRTPFQTTVPPPPPHYAARGAWALWPEAGAGAADIFYIHSTTFYSRKSWNAPIGEADADAEFRRNAAPNEAGPFLGAGAVYAPRYRQATLYSFFTEKYDGAAARTLAYADVTAAFAEFLATTDGERPIVIVGYGQGGLHALGLLGQAIDPDKDLRRRLAVAYILGQATPMSAFGGLLKSIPPCEGPRAVRCVVSYVDYEKRFGGEIDRARRRSMIWTPSGALEPAPPPLLCTNPLTWAIDESYAGPDRHIGAASATGLPLGSPPPALSRTTGAQCVDGILTVDRPQQQFLRRKASFGQKWRVQSFNLFYFDLSEDVRRRIGETARRLDEEARILEPIETSVDLEDSPIHKAPNG